MKLQALVLSLAIVAALPAVAEEDPPAEPTVTELAGKIDAITEAFTEAKNTIDALNRLRLSGYIQAQYLHDERSLNETSGASTR